MRHPWLSFCVRPSSMPCKLTCGMLANMLSCSGSGPWIHKSGRPSAHCIPHSMSSGNTPISLARFSECALAVEFAAICCKAHFRFLAHAPVLGAIGIPTCECTFDSCGLITVNRQNLAKMHARGMHFCSPDCKGTMQPPLALCRWWQFNVDA